MSGQEAPDIHVDCTGELRRLGCLLPPDGFVSAFPVFEDAVPQLSEADILEIARSGVMDGRKRFDKSFVKNQRSHGSCNGFAGAMALTRARIRRGLPRVDLSGAYMYSLINGGQDRGSALDDGMKVLERGVCTEETVGWDSVFRTQYDTAKADAEAKRFRGFECYQTRTRLGVFTAAALGFDLVIAVHVGRNFDQLDSEGRHGVDRGPGNHAVLADGITCVGGNKPALTDTNSWATTWGHEGRMLSTWEALEETTRYHAFYAIRSTGDDPSGNNPPAAH